MSLQDDQVFMKLPVASMLAQASGERGRLFLFGTRKVRWWFLANDIKVLLCFLGCLRILNTPWELGNTHECSICPLQISKSFSSDLIFPVQVFGG